MEEEGGLVAGARIAENLVISVCNLRLYLACRNFDNCLSWRRAGYGNPGVCATLRVPSSESASTS